MDTFWQDVRFGLRTLKKSPAVTGLAIVALALGIGVNTSIFSLVNAVLLRPLPYRDPGQLVQIKKQIARAPDGPNLFGNGEVLAGPDFLDWKESSTTLSHVAAFSGGPVNVTGGERAERIEGGKVTADFFPLLGAQAFLGRTFFPNEDVPNGERVAVITHGLWKRRFSADPEVIGKRIFLDGGAWTIIGVLPATFVFSQPFEIYQPFQIDPVSERAGERMVLLQVLARLKPGTTFDQARAELETILARRNTRAEFKVSGPAATDFVDELTQPLPAPALPSAGEKMISMPFPGPGPAAGAINRPAEKIEVVGLHEQLVGDVRSTLIILLGAVSFVLLIACANVANLLLARATARQKEIAIRTALGAARWRIIRQLLTESFLLAGAGAALGLLLAYWTMDLARVYASAHIATLRPVAIDGWVLAFTIAVSLVTGLLFGMAPAYQSARSEVNESLKDGSRASSGRARNRFRNALVVFESALAIVLLAGACLLLRSFFQLRNTDKGFQPEGALTASINLTGGRYDSQQQAQQFLQQLLERARALPGVEFAGAADHLPLTDYSMLMMTGVEGIAQEGKTPASFIAATPQLFEALKMKLRDGRFFEDRDSSDSAPVAVVNEAFVRRFMNGQPALGRRVRAPGASGDYATIVGIVADVTAHRLESQATPEVYRPFAQAGNDRFRIAIRSSGDLTALASALRGAVHALDAEQPISEVMSMEERLAGALAPRRLNSLLLGIFAGLALALSAVGIYGVMSCVVSQRAHEMGVRLALGAQRGDIFALVINHGLALVGCGIVFGLLGAFALTNSMRAMLYGISPRDPIAFLAAPGALLAAALLACWFPARKATHADPIRALRCE